ncbi:hypothetical protein RR46_06209 [Papilio xuthus]|uniref:Uncharacterized protein n=1 Tax=Papilio xuthus TaxID=66420 RepID=A0A194QHW9_PAPXU|nr:hypothetical protein RR46_06209 [Papilio xuthus]
MALLKMLVILAVIGAVVCDHDYTRRSGLLQNQVANQPTNVQRSPCNDNSVNCNDGNITPPHLELNKKR